MAQSEIAKKITKLEKELKELYRIRSEMEPLAKKGSECDQKNLVFVQRGIDEALKKIHRLETSYL